MALEEVSPSGEKDTPKKPSQEVERLSYWVGEAVRLALALTGQNMNEFNKKSGVAKSSLSRIVNHEGSIDLRTFIKICDELHIPPSVLMMFAEIKEKRHLKQSLTKFEEEIEVVLYNVYWERANNKWDLPEVGIYLKKQDWINAS